MKSLTTYLDEALIDLSDWDVRQVKDMNGMFDRSNRRLTIPDWYED